MSSVYVVKESGKSEPMKVVHCKDEDKELQTILKNNFDLLPGDQIDPDVPCRWMLIKREMPVPDPTTGTDRWSIDFLFVDQNATPTFVECKRYLDTRARREVVGQVLEYAANAQYCWSGDDIRAFAEATAKEGNETFDESFRVVQSQFGDSAENFFKEVERKLKASEIRVVFFLEQAPVELKKLVEFMNKQMGAVEVLLVEAKQYSANGFRVVVPTLFGFTEQIREIKREATIRQGRQPVATDWESFQKNAEQRGLEEETISAIRKVYDVCKSLQADIAWGRGTATGSFSPKWPRLHSSIAPFSVYSNGKLEPHFSSFQNSEVAKEFSEEFSAKLIAGGLKLPPKYRDEWFSISSNTGTRRSNSSAESPSASRRICASLAR
ncbi:MAG: hypothetical protein ABR865_15365 [Terracidiphilus sp.]|jgi:hypothetical protein